MMAGEEIGPDADLELAFAAVREAGEAVMPFFRADVTVSHKGPDQPVTQADLTADALLRERLLDARPDYGWLSEETGDHPDRLGRERVWIVDPLDGTRSFLEGYREFAISVALVESGKAILGVVYNPASPDLYWAARGQGAYHAAGWKGGAPAGQRLWMRDPGREVVRSLLASRSEVLRGEFDALLQRWEIRPLGSTACKLAAVAAGTGHAYLSRGPKSEWDVAAGGLLVQEAGGTATDLGGTALRYNRADPSVKGVLAAPPSLHGELLETIVGLPSPRLGGTGGGGSQGD